MSSGAGHASHPDPLPPGKGDARSVSLESNQSPDHPITRFFRTVLRLYDPAVPLKILLGRVLFGLLFAAAGLWMARLSLLAIARRREWKRDGVVVEGRVTGFEQRADLDPSDLRPLFAPIVSFIRSDGESGHFTASTATRPNPYVVGQKVAVRYLRSSPLEADLDSATAGSLAIFALVTLAIVFLGVALLPILMPAPQAPPLR